MAADIKTSAAFGGAKVTEELKQELFSSAGGNSLQSRLQQHVAGAGQQLNRNVDNSGSFLQSLADMDYESRSAYLNEKIEELQSNITPLVKEASEMLNYYVRVQEYQKQVLLAYGLQTGQKQLIVDKMYGDGVIKNEKLSADVQEAIHLFREVKRLNNLLRSLQSGGGSAEGLIQCLNGLGGLYRHSG